MVRWLFVGFALAEVAGQPSAQAREPVEQAVADAVAHYLKGNLNGCHASLRAVEAQAWVAPPVSRNRWHRQVWQCEVRQNLDNPESWARWSNWMGEWLRRFEDEPDVDLRFQESTRVIQWFFRATAGESLERDIATVLEPLVERVAQQPEPQQLPFPPDMARLLLVLGEMGGHLVLEPHLRAWRTRLADRLGVDHLVVLTADKALAFSSRKAGRMALAAEQARDAWERHERRAVKLPSVRQALSSELAAAMAARGQLGEALAYAQLTQDILAGIPGEVGLRPGRAAYNTAAIALALGDFEMARDAAQASMRHFMSSDSYAVGEAEYAQQLLQQARLELNEPGASRALAEALRASTATSDWVGPAALRLLAWSQANDDPAGAATAKRFFADYIDTTKTVFHPERTTQELLDSQQAAAVGDRRTARQALARAWLQAYAGRSAEHQAAAWLAWAEAENADGRREWAIWSGKHAAAVLLPALADLTTEQRAGWLDVRRSLLQRLQSVVLWLAEAGRLPEAEALAADLQAGEVRHYLARGGLRSAEASRPAWTTRESAWSRGIEALQREMDATLERDRAGGTEVQPWQRGQAHGLADVKRREALRDGLAQALLDWRDQAEAQQGSTSPAADRSPVMMEQKSAQAFAKRPLPAGTALLWWAVSEERLMVVARTRNRQWTHIAPVGRSELMRQVLLAREEVRDDARLRTRALAQLHEWLISPVEPALRAHRINHLRLRPSAELQAVPFGALHRACQDRPYLIERFALSVQTLEAGKRADGPRPSLWALGNTRGETEADSLPWVAQEVSDVVREARVRYRKALDRRFDWRSLQEALSEPVGAVHLATHFRMHPSLPHQSYLLLGDSQRASLAQLSSLPWRNAGLTVISACDTGIGSGAVAVASLRQVLQSSGAGPVIASLWSVQDESTAHLMPLFYRHWRQQGWSTQPSAAQALSLAQRTWLRQHRGQVWAHPRHWAGFVWFE